MAIRAEAAGAEGVYRRLFAAVGCEVVSSTSSERAPDLVAQVGDAVDVLVLDAAVVLKTPAAFARPLPAIGRTFVFAPVGIADDVRRVLDGRPLELVTTPFSPAGVEQRVREVVAELARAA